MAVPKYNAPTWAPADEAFAVTPLDATLFPQSTRALYVGVAGNVVVEMALTGATITFSNVPAGTLLPICVLRVKTATTASQIVALY